MLERDSGTLNAKAAAQFVGLSPSTLAKMRLSGNSPAFLKLGRRVLYRRVDISAWGASRIAANTLGTVARRPKSLTGPQRT